MVTVNTVKFGHLVSEICKQTDRQTDTLFTTHHTSLYTPPGETITSQQE